jgi:hypothetical protein
MGADRCVARFEVGGREDRLNVVQRHVEVAEAANDLRDRNLIGRVAPISRIGVDAGGVENADAMVMAQRLDAQVRRPSEVPDR